MALRQRASPESRTHSNNEVQSRFSRRGRTACTRQPCGTSRQYETFQVYLALGPMLRSLQSAADELSTAGASHLATRLHQEARAYDPRTNVVLMRLPHANPRMRARTVLITDRCRHLARSCPSSSVSASPLAPSRYRYTRRSWSHQTSLRAPSLPLASALLSRQSRVPPTLDACRSLLSLRVILIVPTSSREITVRLTA